MIEGAAKPARKPPPSLDLTHPATPLAISDTGSLRDGDVSLNMQGLRISSDGASSSAPGQSDKEYVGMQRDDMETVRPLGEGTSGVVQLVRHKPTGHLMALKVISLGISERERKQILQELRVLHRALVQGERQDASDARESVASGAAAAAPAEKRVPSIISFYGAFYTDGAIHIALEYMDRGSLHDVLRHKGPIDERVLACIATQVLRGLEALQELKIVHRDVKPANVLLNSEGDIKLADFGMCGELANSFSRLRSWVGTAAYMSPERISGADYSFNSDIWALGVTIWECAAGRYPFGAAPAPSAANAGLLPEEAGTGLTFWELLHNIVEGGLLEPMPGRELLSGFLALSLKRNPAERPDAKVLLRDPWLVANSSSQATLRTWVQEVVSSLPVAGADLQQT